MSTIEEDLQSPNADVRFRARQKRRINEYLRLEMLGLAPSKPERKRKAQSERAHA